MPLSVILLVIFVTLALAILFHRKIRLAILLIEMAFIHAGFLVRLGIAAACDSLDLL